MRKTLANWCPRRAHVVKIQVCSQSCRILRRGMKLRLSQCTWEKRNKDGPETKSFLCWTENDIAKCVQENWEETGDSSAHVLKQDHCQKWPGENRVCSACSSRSQSSSRKSKEKLKLGGKVRVGIGRNWHSIERRVLFAGFPSLCCSACCFISSKIPCPGLTLSTVS